MAVNQTGIAITIKAWLPTGKTFDEQFEALSLVKDAHATGDYSKVLAASKIDEVKAEQKVRRIEVETEITAGSGDMYADIGAEKPEPEPEPELTAAEPEPEALATAPNEPDDADVPEFLKKTKKTKAA